MYHRIEPNGPGDAFFFFDFFFLMLTWLASCRITNRLLTPKGYLQELITHAPNPFGERWFWFWFPPDDDTYGVVAYGFGAPSPPATHQRYRCSPTGELLPDPTLPRKTYQASRAVGPGQFRRDF